MTVAVSLFTVKNLERFLWKDLKKSKYCIYFSRAKLFNFFLIDVFIYQSIYKVNTYIKKIDLFK